MAEAREASEYAAVRLPRELVRQLGIIAKHKGKPIGEIVADWIETRADRDYRVAVNAMHAELGENGAG